VAPNRNHARLPKHLRMAADALAEGKLRQVLTDGPRPILAFAFTTQNTDISKQECARFSTF